MQKEIIGRGFVTSSTWESREVPILEAVALAEEIPGGDEADVDWLAERSGLDVDQVKRGLKALVEAGYVTGIDATTLGGFDMLDVRLLAPGRRAIGQWPPADSFNALIRLLEEQIAREADPERRSRLQRFLDATNDVGKSVAGGVLTALIRQMAGI